MTPRLNANEARWQVSQEHAIIKELIKPTSFPPVFLGGTIACEKPRRQSRGRKWAKRRRRKEENATGSLIMTLLQLHAVRRPLPLRTRRQRICGRQVHHESLSVKRSDLPTPTVTCFHLSFLFLLFVSHHAPKPWSATLSPLGDCQRNRPEPEHAPAESSSHSALRWRRSAPRWS
ncbi:hypothetical protein MTO96_009841 [Rhipicephalus appendiculatus]